jgi:glycosyltransferase involved in cell wall biosynthesis
MLKKVLYMTNIETPYRVRFFNELAKHCDLTVLYEKRSVENRNEVWAKSAQSKHRRRYLPRESIWFSGILGELHGDYDVIIVGCYNSPVQMIAQLYMRLRGIPYIINLDGEAFLKGKGIKTQLKKFFLSGAQKYLIAGEKAALSLQTVVGDKRVIPYGFSSLTENELEDGRLAAENCERDNTVLVVGQYFDYKGMDIALDAARMDLSIKYKFVGMGSRTDLFVHDHEVPPNVEIVPFLQKRELEKAYQTCGMLLLPSRQECWGLVVNEAAAFGMPVVSTWGSGAAVEFLSERYPQFLAKQEDAEDLLLCIKRVLAMENKAEYQQFLLGKSSAYSIEKSVAAHIAVFADNE